MGRPLLKHPSSPIAERGTMVVQLGPTTKESDTMNIVIYGVTQAQYEKIEDIVLFSGGDPHMVENTGDLEKDFEIGGDFTVLDQVDTITEE